jgi:hypothetical protein
VTYRRHWSTLRGHYINWHKGSEGLRPSWSQSKKQVTGIQQQNNLSKGGLLQ